MFEGRLLPQLDENSAPFFEFAARGELRVQECSRCGARRVPPRPMCASCGSFEFGWVQLSGKGTVWSLAIPHAPLLPAYEAFAPYNVIVVAAAEDPTIRFVGNLLEHADGPLNGVDPHTIEIGEPVRVVFPAPIDDGEGAVVMPQWVRDA